MIRNNKQYAVDHMFNSEHMSRLIDSPDSTMRVISNRLLHVIHKLNTNKFLTFLDIGTMNAIDSINLVKIFDELHVYAFEPVRENHIQCEKNIERQLPNIKDRLQVHRLALNDTTGPIEFWELNTVVAAKRGRLNRGIGSKYEIINPEMIPYEYNIQRQTTVFGCRLDDWCNDNDIPAIDGILIDVQGSELDVFNGAGSFLNTVQVIIADICIKPCFHMQPTKSEIDDYLKDRGFIEWIPARIAVSPYKMNSVYLNQNITNL